MSIQLTWYGTASIKVQALGQTILLDPFLPYPHSEDKGKLEDFLGSDVILISHSHLDHLSTVPDILKREGVPVYGTTTTCRILGERENIHLIAPGSTFSIGEIGVSVYKGKHISFDVPLILRTLNPVHVLPAIGNLPKLLKNNKAYPENGETVCYQLSVAEKIILFLGSLGLDEKTDYPTGADLLFLPYQGSSYLPRIAKTVLERLRPKAIFLTHFDNTFPPISSHVPLAPLFAMLRENFPDLKVHVPVFGKPVLLK